MRFLITLDGSSFSEAVLDPARRFIQAANAETHLMRVGEPPPHVVSEPRLTPRDAVSDYGSVSGRPMMEEEEASLTIDAHQETYSTLFDQTEHELLEYLEDKGAVFSSQPVTYNVVLSQEPALQIVDYAKEIGADLIMMATHGRSGLAALIQGSVAGEVVRSGVAPVMLVRPLE